MSKIFYRLRITTAEDDLEWLRGSVGKGAVCTPRRRREPEQGGWGIPGHGMVGGCQRAEKAAGKYCIPNCYGLALCRRSLRPGGSRETAKGEQQRGWGYLAMSMGKTGIAEINCNKETFF